MEKAKSQRCKSMAAGIMQKVNEQTDKVQRNACDQWNCRKVQRLPTSPCSCTSLKRQYNMHRHHHNSDTSCIEHV